MNSVTIKEQLTHALHWAQGGSRLMYISITVGVLVGLVLFRIFFKNIAGFVHCIAFSLGAPQNSTVAAQPGLSRWSRLKLFLGTVLPAGSGYAAYFFLPRWFPTFFH
ncbi:MAG TPA: hypothetical protein VG167_05375 [Verrucomicrobiae bacterium]|nr:hypothetical protein [Verrucomicrobiae bacterium]